jgi:hypothetical protein
LFFVFGGDVHFLQKGVKLGEIEREIELGKSEIERRRNLVRRDSVVEGVDES